MGGERGGNNSGGLILGDQGRPGDWRRLHVRANRPARRQNRWCRIKRRALVNRRAVTGGAGTALLAALSIGRDGERPTEDARSWRIVQPNEACSAAKARRLSASIEPASGRRTAISWP